MPPLSRLMIRLALGWLAVGYSVGGLLLANKGVPLAPWIWQLRGAHVHMLLVGWTLQLAEGVAYWIMPRLDARGDRGGDRPVWLGCAALNAGVVCALLPGLAAASGALYLVTAAAFVAHLWRRVRPFG